MIEEKIQDALNEANRQLGEVLEEGKSLPEYLNEVKGKIKEFRQKYDDLIKGYLVGGKEFSSLIGYCMESRKKEIGEVRSKLDDLRHKSRVMDYYNDFLTELTQVEKAADAAEEDREGILSPVYETLLRIAEFSAHYKKAAKMLDETLSRCQIKIADYEKEVRELSETIKNKYNCMEEVEAEYRTRKGDEEKLIDDFPDLNERYEKLVNKIRDLRYREERFREKLNVFNAVKTIYEEEQTAAKTRVEELAPRVALYEAACCLMGKDPQEEIKKYAERKNIAA